jgi:hypothetical protein
MCRWSEMKRQMTGTEGILIYLVDYWILLPVRSCDIYYERHRYHIWKSCLRTRNQDEV